MTQQSGIRTAATRLGWARRVTVLTGAGVSAASGVPTFRGPEGLWRAFRPEQLASVEAFARDPRVVWEWYDWRRQQIAACRPNRAHEVLAAWARRFTAYTLLTQNVDGLHERAGLADTLRLHGSIWELSCWSRCPTAPPAWRDERAPLPDLPPQCPHCGGLARPAVVWFGEPLDLAVLARAEAALSCDVFMTVGTSAIVYPSAAFVHAARRRGAFTIEVNPDATPATDVVDLAIAAPAETALDEIDRQMPSP